MGRTAPVNELQRFSPQRQARALGDPTRHAIFRYVEAAPAPVGVAELTEHFELNHNTVRQHLAQLRDAGLLVEGIAAPAGPGRRRLEYRPAPGARAWGSASPYERLALLLLDVIGSGRSPREIGRAAGRDVVESLASEGVVDGLQDIAARAGFEPRRVERRGVLDLVLERCPYAEAAAADPVTVCELHRGIAEGAAEVLAGGADVAVELTARDPYRAGCRLRIQREQGRRGLKLQARDKGVRRPGT
jgi:predicted ArsR family transcriptional regulator